MKSPNLQQYQHKSPSRRQKKGSEEIRTNYQIAQDILTIFLQFQDRKLKKEYILYNLHTKNISFLIFLIFIYSCIVLPFTLVILSTQIAASIGHLTLLIIMVLCLLSISILGWFFILYKLFPRWKLTRNLISTFRKSSKQIRKGSTKVIHYLKVKYSSKSFGFLQNRSIISPENLQRNHNNITNKDDDDNLDDDDGNNRGNDEDEDDKSDVESNFSYSSHNFYQQKNQGTNSNLLTGGNSLIQPENMKIKELFIKIQHILMSSVIICNIAFYINMAMKFDCHEPTSVEFLNDFLNNCNNSNLVYVYLFYAFMLTPIIVSVIFKECLFEFHVLHHFLIMIIALTITAVYNFNINSIVIFSVWSLGGLLLLIDIHIANVAAFVISYNLKKTLVENEKTADRMHASEMRHMIGNVAHDLKTPLASFTTGLEIIADIINDSDRILMQKRFTSHQQHTAISRAPSQSHNVSNNNNVNALTISPLAKTNQFQSHPNHQMILNSQVPTLSPNNSQVLNELSIDNRFLEHNNSIKHCLQNIRDTNTFMLMTINRCIDYTKASRGFKLVPKLETVSVLDTMKLPLDCMKNIQEKIEIQLKPINFQEICPYIITDKQWLQENILCLLSNAVKYSTEGIVTISASIVKVDPPRPKVMDRPILQKAPSMNILATSSNFLRRLSVVSLRSGLTLRGSTIFNRNSKRIQNEDGNSISSHSIAAAAAALIAGEENKEGGNKDSNNKDQELDEQISPRVLTKTTPMPSDDQVEPNPTRLNTSQPSPQPPSGLISRNNSDINRKRGLSNSPCISPALSPRDDVSASNSPISPPRPAFKRPMMNKGLSRNDLMRDKTGIGATHFIRFEIDDHGIGMSNEAMADLFSPFKQAQRLAGGTGLGLYSLAKRVEALNGAYGVSKRPDGLRGTLFWFSIPYRPDTTTAELNANIPSNNTATNSPNNGPFASGYLPSCNSLPKDDSKQLNDLQRAASRSPLVLSPNNSSLTIDAFNNKLSSLHVLIVDDSPSIVKMSTMLLKRQGHVIKSAENGEIALRTIQEQWETQKRGFDVILMDLQMPVMDGLEATRRLRQMEREGRDWMVFPPKTNQGDQHPNGHSPMFSMSNMFHSKKFRHAVIGVSANSDHESAGDALDAGMDDFIAKPFTMESFTSTVVKVLSKIHDM